MIGWIQTTDYYPTFWLFLLIDIVGCLGMIRAGIWCWIGVSLHDFLDAMLLAMLISVVGQHVNICDVAGKVD